MEEKKVLVFARFDVLHKANGMVVDKGEVYVELNKEQYDRLKASYDTGEFKLMNEDLSLLDIYKVVVMLDDVDLELNHINLLGGNQDEELYYYCQSINCFHSCGLVRIYDSCNSVCSCNC